MVCVSPKYIDCMFLSLIKRGFQGLPSQCMVCRAWPSQPVCEACVTDFAQPRPRCQTCAMPVAEDVKQCEACLQTPPSLDACLAAVAYAFPWSDLIVGYKFQQQPGRAAAFALLLRSTPWVEPALDAADAVLPMPLSRQRLQTRGFNQALLLAQHLAPDKVNHRLLHRIKDTPPQSSLKRAERLQNLQDAFAIDPLQRQHIAGARLVLVDDLMTSGASLHAVAQVLKAAGAAHITGLVVARTQ